MLIAGADIETTGLDAEKGHRIVEVYVGLWDEHGNVAAIPPLNLRIHPKRSIDPDAQMVHGISITDLEGCPDWESVAPEVREYLESADLVVGHNWDGFDAGFINTELKRVGLPPLTKPTFDTMLNGRWATGVGAVPNLGALCFACGVEYDPEQAHAAHYDVEVMMDCFFKGLSWGFYQLPEALRVAA